MILLLALIQGCSSVKDVEPTQLKFDEATFSNETINRSLFKLTQSAEAAVEAQMVLAEITNGLAAQQMDRVNYNEFKFQTSYVPEGMGRTVGDIEWSGPALPLLKVVAEVAGYDVAEPAHAPLFEPVARIDTTQDEKNYTVMDIIRSIEVTNRESINIEIHEENKIININYLY